MQGHLDLDPGLAHRVAHDADHLVLGLPQAGHGIDHQPPGTGIAQVEKARDRGNFLAGQDQLAERIAAHHDVEDARIFQKLALQRLIEHHGLVGQHGRRGDLCPFQTRQQVILAEARDGGNEDQNFGQHHENDRQDQEPA